MTEDDIDRLALDMGEKLAHAGLRHEDDFADILVSIGLYEGPAILLDEAVPIVELRFEAGMDVVAGGMACVEQDVLGHGVISVRMGEVGGHGNRRRGT